MVNDVKYGHDHSAPRQNPKGLVSKRVVQERVQLLEPKISSTRSSSFMSELDASICPHGLKKGDKAEGNPDVCGGFSSLARDNDDVPGSHAFAVECRGL